MSVTMKDIALMAGVSQQAVSAALNGNSHSRVSEQTRRKILKLAEELNYVPNAAAAALSGRDSRTVGIMAANLDGLNGCLVEELTWLLARSGCNAVTTFFAASIFDASKAVAALASRGVRGIIALDAQSRDKLLKLLPVPSVFSFGDAAGKFDVLTDHGRIAGLAVEHLVEVHGHRRLGFVTPLENSNNTKYHGFCAALRACGIEPEPAWEIILRHIGGNAEKLFQYLKQHGITAIFASNDYVGCKIVKAAMQHGVRVPEDLAVIGCDGYSFTEFNAVSLTTVVQPVRERAKTIIRLLEQRIERNEMKPPPAGIMLEPVLHIGGSCGCKEPIVNDLYQLNTFSLLERDEKMNFYKADNETT
jgi:LacI family transcriptional regulator